jgi:hypothetical protein
VNKSHQAVCRTAAPVERVVFDCALCRRKACATSQCRLPLAALPRGWTSRGCISRRVRLAGICEVGRGVCGQTLHGLHAASKVCVGPPAQSFDVGDRTLRASGGLRLPVQPTLCSATYRLDGWKSESFWPSQSERRFENEAAGSRCQSRRFYDCRLWWPFLRSATRIDAQHSVRDHG